MRAWLPEQQVYGPEPATERDVAGLNRVFADAFTDRYRRDGLVGVRVPYLNPQVWRYALLDAAPAPCCGATSRGISSPSISRIAPGPKAGWGRSRSDPTARAAAWERRSSARRSTGCSSSGS